MKKNIKQEDNKDFLIRCLKRFDAAYKAGNDERMQSQQDRRFYSIAGAQYEGNYAKLFENKPKPEFNKCHQAVIRAISEYRNNRIDVNFIPKNGKSDELADLCDNLYRADYQDSQGLEAIDNAYEEALGGGFGAFRLCSEYEDDDDEENDRKRIAFIPIPDADQRAWFDHNAMRMDKSDADWACVLTPYIAEEYEDTFEDTPASWPIDKYYQQFDWATSDQVFVAEWYEKEKVKDLVIFFTDLSGVTEKIKKSEFDDNEDFQEYIENLTSRGFKETKRKSTTTTRIHKWILSGGAILEDCGYIAGNQIPIIPVYCKRWYVNGIERFMGIVRPAKDPQRLKNAMIAMLAEIAAYSPVRKPIFTPQQMAGGLGELWANDIIDRNRFLLVNPVQGADGSVQALGPVGYDEPPPVPQALVALLQLTESDMQEILGNNQSADKLVSNISAQAVDLIQQRVDVSMFLPMSNLARSLQRAGAVWLSMAKDEYTEEKRELKTVDKEGVANSVVIKDEPFLDEKTGDVLYQNDLSRATFDVYAEVGPATSSARNATVRNLMSILQVEQDPKNRAILTAIIMQNMEGEGIKEVKDYYRTVLVDMGVAKPNEQEMLLMQQKLQSQQPTSESIYLEAMAEEAMAKAAKARVDTILTTAKVEETQAGTLKTLSEIDQQARQQAMANIAIQQKAQQDQQAQIKQAIDLQNQGMQQPQPPAAIGENPEGVGNA